MNTSQNLLAQAHALQQQGRLAEAVAAYRKLLSTEPRNAQALHLLGVTLARMGSPQEAVVCLANAVEIEPANPAMRINLGNALTELGHHGQAVTHYQRAVALKPDFAQGHRALALGFIRTARLEEALASLTQAMRLVPGDSRLYNDMGVICGRLGRRTEALGYFEHATRYDPNYAEAFRNRGAVDLALGKYEDALASLDRALALQPKQPVIHNERGDALLALGRFAEAASSYDNALALGLRDATIFRNRGAALLELGRDADAMASLDYALQLAPGSLPVQTLRAKLLLRFGRAQDALASLDSAFGSPAAPAPAANTAPTAAAAANGTGTTTDAPDFDFHFNRGVALSMLDRHEESLSSFDKALRLNADSVETLNNRAVELGHLSRPQEALESLAGVLARKPDHFGSYTNSGNLLKGLGRFDEARSYFDSALRIAPEDPMTLWSKGLLELSQGHLAAGWPLYEARFRLPSTRDAQPTFDVPRWSGEEEPLAGKTILVHAEQGLGDTVQFCRFVPLLEARGAEVILQVQPDLVGLLRSLKIRGQVVANTEPLPHFDLHCPLLSLPLALRTELQTIPNDVPYLAVDPERVTSMRARLDALPGLPGLKAGLNWQGNVETEKQPWLRGRSFPLALAAPLLDVPDVSWISVQRGPGAEQREQAQFGDRLAQVLDPLELGAAAVLETAALVKALDLVVTSDTFIAHLCGALAVPVWTVVQAVPDWRWLLERTDNPWYPTLRLFRQRVPGEWPELFTQVAAELQTWSHRIMKP